MNVDFDPRATDFQYNESQMFAGRLPEEAFPHRLIEGVLAVVTLASLLAGEGGGQVQAQEALVGDGRRNLPASLDHYGPDPHNPNYISDWQPQCEGDKGGLVVGNEQFYIVGKYPNDRILHGGLGTEVASKVEVTMDGQDTCGNPYYQTRYKNAAGEPVVHTVTGDYARNGAGGITGGK